MGDDGPSLQAADQRRVFGDDPVVLAREGEILREEVVERGDEDADFLFQTELDGQRNRRHRGKRLDVDEQVYVAGQAVPAAEADVAPDGQRYAITGGGSMLAKKPSGLTGTPFVVADSGEDAAQARLLRGALLKLGLGVVLVGIGGPELLFGLAG